MIFRTHEQDQTREAARLATIDGLKAEVAGYDPNPLTPGETFIHSDTFEGCYSGRVLALADEYAAVLSVAGDRVAILPTHRFKTKPVAGESYAFASWGLTFHKLARLGTTFTLGDGRPATYDAIDAFDDFQVALQRELDWESLIMGGISAENSFVLQLSRLGNVNVSRHYTEYVNYLHRTGELTPAGRTLTATELEELMIFLWAKNRKVSIGGDPMRLSASEIRGKLRSGGFITDTQAVLAAIRVIDAEGRHGQYDVATIRRLIPEYDGV
jgi:hypothetical protein